MAGEKKMSPGPDDACDGQGSILQSVKELQQNGSGFPVCSGHKRAAKRENRRCGRAWLCVPAETAGGELAGFTRLGISVDAVPADGRPIPAIVEADQADAWNLYRNVPVGSIWLRRSADGTIVAFSATCPHLGCSVDYRSEAGDFFCPCHTSTFDLDGIPQNEVPPRSMDRLQVRTATNGIPDPQGTEIWVEFLEFRGSTDQKIPV